MERITGALGRLPSKANAPGVLELGPEADGAAHIPARLGEELLAHLFRAGI